MNKKNYFKAFGAFFVLIMLAFGCQTESEEKSTANTVTITFDVNGKTGTAPEKIKATIEKVIELPVMEDDRFVGWNTKADGSGKSYSGNGKFTEDTTLYAVYLKAGEYRIIYHLDGGVNNPENPLTYKEEDYFGLQEPTREGYYFVGWKRKDGTIKKRAYIDGYYDHDNLEFTAVWAEQKYKIVYHSNYGTDEIFEHYFAPDELLVNIYNPFLRDDYTLTGWYQDKDCTELYKFVYGDMINVINKTEDIHLYAGWTKNIYSNLKIKVTNLPNEVKALSFWGSPNEWLLENIQKEADKYIVDVINGGTAEFSFDKFNIVVPLWCQFVPMTSKDMPMNDATWWQTAFSGSDTYAKAENNLVYDFAANGAKNSMTLTLDVSAVYGDTSGVFKKRFNTENYTTALTASW